MKAGKPKDRKEEKGNGRDRACIRRSSRHVARNGRRH